MNFRFRALVIIIILSGMAYIAFFSVDASRVVPILKPLNTLPEEIGGLKAVEGKTLEGEVIRMLGVDEYLDRLYVSPDSGVIDLYVSYFTQLKEGKQFHSPKNCLIGSGSTYVSTQPVEINLPGRRKPVKVNFMLLEKGNNKQLILYWYQCRGRIITSEYWEKVYRVIDSFILRRTDGSFIRISCYDQGAGVDRTLASMKEFTMHVIPILNQYIPGR